MVFLVAIVTSALLFQKSKKCFLETFYIWNIFPPFLIWSHFDYKNLTWLHLNFFPKNVGFIIFVANNQITFHLYYFRALCIVAKPFRKIFATDLWKISTKKRVWNIHWIWIAGPNILIMKCIFTYIARDFFKDLPFMAFQNNWTLLGPLIPTVSHALLLQQQPICNHGPLKIRFKLGCELRPFLKRQDLALLRR